MSAVTELRRLLAIGETPVWKISDKDREFFRTHPLVAIKGDPYERPLVLGAVADWLEEREPDPIAVQVQDVLMAWATADIDAETALNRIGTITQPDFRETT